MQAQSKSIAVTRVGRAGDDRQAEVVVEEPLEIRISGDPLAVTMRTPGADRQLVLGFLWAEGIIAALDDVSAIAHCGRPGDPGYQNTIEVTPAPGARLVLPEDGNGAQRRGTLMTSACGVCGRRSIDDLLARVAPVAPSAPFSAEIILRAAASLRDTQPLFARTGGCHGAALFSRAGEHVATYEDVGRHNAVDKLVGSRLLAHALPAVDHALLVSGRTSFEIVQKALAAGIALVAGISAPSTLAIETAERAGMTLVGFVRGAELVVYAGTLA